MLDCKARGTILQLMNINLAQAGGEIQTQGEVCGGEGVAGAKEVAEELEILGEIGETRPSAAKAGIDPVGFMRGLKPPPPSGPSFSAACKAQPYLFRAACGTTEVVPCYKASAHAPCLSKIDIHLCSFLRLRGGGGGCSSPLMTQHDQIGRLKAICAHRLERGGIR